MAAHDPGKTNRAAIVGDNAHIFGDFICVAIKSVQFLTGLAETGIDFSLQLVGVIGMKWSGAIERNIVGDINQKAFGLNANCDQSGFARVRYLLFDTEEAANQS